MRLPRALLRYMIGLEPHLGADANGPLHGPPEQRQAYVEDVIRTATGAEGRVTYSETRVWLQLDRDITPQWRCTVEGSPREVVAVAHLEGRVGTPDHTLLTLR